MVDGIVGQVYTERILLTDDDGAAITGETFTISNAVNPSGASWAGPTVPEVGMGAYDITFTPSSSGVWRARLTGDTSGQVVEWWANIAAALDTSLLHTAPITTAMTVYQGDDYQDEEGRQYQWTETNWSDLTGATVELTITHRGSPVTQAGTVTNPGTATQTVTVELTAAQTASLTVGAQAGRYKLVATLANGHVETLAHGVVNVVAP